MTETLGTSKGVSPRAPESPRTTLSPGVNELSVNAVNGVNNNDIMTDRDRTSVSTASTPERGSANTNNLSGVYTNTIQIQRKNCIRAIRVSELQWKLFLQKARELGFSANELINQFINSIVLQAPAQQTLKSQVTFNVAIAKAEAKPVISIGEYLARKELDDLLAKVNRLKERAEREKCVSDMPVTFTVEQAKKLEESIKKTLKELKSRSLEPEKLQEVEAALMFL